MRKSVSGKYASLFDELLRGQTVWFPTTELIRLKRMFPLDDLDDYGDGHVRLKRPVVVKRRRVEGRRRLEVVFDIDLL